MVVFLLLLTSLLCRRLWHNRKLHILRLLHWFQPFDDDHSKQFDGFVSYTSADWDLRFVTESLVPHLEGKMNFNLCLHHRDFVAGSFIADNITEAVRRSRRTLLVVTSAYLHSTWCKFEYQVALHEMLGERHRVLPIVMCDVTRDNMEPTLTSLLDVVTWLEYPGDGCSQQELNRFWERLQLSMPKKRPNDER